MKMPQITSLSYSFATIAIASLSLGMSSCKSTSSTATNESNTPVLRFSAIPDEDTTAQKERFAPVVQWLSKELGVKVEFIISPSYASSIEKFETGDIQLAWFGGVTGVQAREAVPNAKAIIAGAKDLQFKSYFIANSSTGLTRSEKFPTAIKDLTFTFGSSSSTSGCVMPAYYIYKNTGKSPRDFFTHSPGFSGSHNKTASQVENGVYQSGVINYSVYNKLVAQKKLDPEKCRVIWETPQYADYNFTAHPKLEKMFGPGFTEKLKKALLNCHDPAVLKAFDRKKFVEVNNDTFSGVAVVLKKVKLK